MATYTVPLYINGKEVQSSTTYDVTSPSTGEVLHKASSASVADAIHAVEAAQAAFKSWAAVPPAQKASIFLKAADIIDRRTQELGKYEQDEAGATVGYSSGFDVPTAAAGLRDVAGRIPTIMGTFPAMSDPSRSALILQEPYGVILGIAPWNATYILGFRAISYALAAGNTAVLKASEFSPRSLASIAEIFKEAGLPDGVLNVISHRPEDASAVTTALIEHPSIRKINFTGSTIVGRIIAQLAAKHLKPVLLELGGKAPAIVCADADLKLAATACTVGAFMHSGQVCMATERIIVHKSIISQFETELKAAIEQIFPSSGDALVLVNAKGAEKNHALLADAVSKGASIVYGDVTAKESSGNRMRPVVIKGLNKDMDLYYAESFGPSVALFEFESEEEALEIANDTEYGLSSAVFTECLLTGLRLAKGIESGAVHINAMSIHDEPGLPHGGVKGSGWGRFGSVGLGEWLKTKTITFAN